MMPTHKPIPGFLRSLRAREAEMTRMLGEFVRVESPSLNKSAVDKFGKMVATEWRRRGANVKVFSEKTRGNHIRAEISLRPKDTTGQILVLGHLDTVYDVGTLAEMPFKVVRGHAWGPGTFDMKSGLVIALFAVDALVAARVAPEKRIVFLWTSDEEIGSGTSRALIERTAKQSDAVLVLEPAAGLDGRLKTGRKGVGEIELVVTGRAAHSGLNPADGVNAIEEIASQVAHISKWNQPKRGVTVNVGLIEGGTRTNVIPHHARALVDLRATHFGDMRKIEEKFRALRPNLPDAKLRITGGFNRPPMERKMSADLYAKAYELGIEMGLELGETFVGGGSDGNFTAAIGVPTLDGLGAVGEGAHSPRENVVLRALPERAALLAGLLATL
jgi:glutamate carboxypeptidase